MTTRAQAIAEDVVAMFKARNPVIWVVTKEEARAERYIMEAAIATKYVPRTWDVAQGFSDLQGRPITESWAQSPTGGPANDPDTALQIVGQRAARSNVDRCVWVFRDLAPWVSGPIGLTVQRRLRNLARTLPGTAPDYAQAIVVITPTADIPAELSNHVTVVDWPLPCREEIGSILDSVLAGIANADVRKAAAPNGTRDAAIEAAIGLTGEEAAACYARSLVQLKKIDPAAVAREKKRIVTRERVLEWYDPLPGGLDAVGGLEVMKEWLRKRGRAYSKEARAYGVPKPRGIFEVGVSGCGKTFSAKAIATTWNVPLLKIDMGSLKSKFVGESEANLRKAFAVIEAIGPCVVWFDEIEKAFAGATQGAADGGVSSDALGTFLTWMQERKGDAFVIATANDITGLPPEFTRKGRFDEIFFIDLPTHTERAAVLRSTLKSSGRNEEIDADQVAAVTSGFTGAEIAALVPEALFAAFDDGARPITTGDLVDAAITVVPLSKSSAEKLKVLKDWARGRARRASAEEPEELQQGSSGRVLEI